MCELALFVFIVTGILPREFAWVLAALLVGYSLGASLENAVIVFVMSIPLFIALPITATFDNFNTWRIVSLVILIRWFVARDTRHMLMNVWREIRRQPMAVLRKYPAWSLMALLGVLAALSLIGAPDLGAGAKRIIYFANLAFVPIVIFDLLRRFPEFSRRLIRAIAVPTAVAVIVGIVQVAATYLMDIYQFMRIWGEGIQLRQFGTEWSNIAVWLGNTWFAYYGEQLSLRVFSLFPDSHSFPQFVLLGIPALFALIPRRRVLGAVLAISALLTAILSGTRGIWAASIGVVLWAVGVWLWMRWKGASLVNRKMLGRVGAGLAAFYLLFAVAWPVFTSPQFLMAKGDWRLMRNRIRSIIDFGETSNSQRIEIWRRSIISIAHHPVLGVGIGNFPVVLDQRIELARAGSSAHNVYLHIAAEMGIPALAAALALIGLLIVRTYRAFLMSNDTEHRAYFATLLMIFPWVFIYSLTDVAIFDERAFLFFLTAVALASARGT